jgi:excisionase family DNA binding protein
VPSEAQEPTFLDQVAHKLISVTEASALSGLTTSYIRRLLRQKNVPGVKVGRDWFTTEDAIRTYLAQDRRPGPKSA